LNIFGKDNTIVRYQTNTTSLSDD